MSKSDRQTFTANVVLKSERGLSMADEPNYITKNNIKDFLPSKETMSQAIQELQKLGFTVPEASFFDKCKTGSARFPTITIIGKPELFEKVFNVRPIDKKSATSVESSRKRGDSTVGKRVTPPDNLKELIDYIFFTDVEAIFLKTTR